MANAFFIFDPNKRDVQERDDKIIPDPVELGNSEIIVDGKKTVITATSGTLQYPLIEPCDYPQTEDERQARRGSVRS